MNNEHRLWLCGGGCNEQDAQLVLHTDSRLFDRPLDGLFDLGESMNKEDIILMADASGLSLYGMGKDREQFIDYLECFADLIASAEREACAKQLDALGCDHCATAIRARGQA